jgi:hypothetical protein
MFLQIWCLFYSRSQLLPEEEQLMGSNSLRKQREAGRWLLTPVILATQEAREQEDCDLRPV